MYQNWAVWDFLQSPIKHLLLAITGNRILNQMDHQSVLRELVSDAIPTLKVSTPAQMCSEGPSAYSKKIIKSKLST